MKPHKFVDVKVAQDDDNLRFTKQRKEMHTDQHLLGSHLAHSKVKIDGQVLRKEEGENMPECFQYLEQLQSFHNQVCDCVTGCFVLNYCILAFFSFFKLCNCFDFNIA